MIMAFHLSVTIYLHNRIVYYKYHHELNNSIAKSGYMLEISKCCNIPVLSSNWDIYVAFLSRIFFREPVKHY